MKFDNMQQLREYIWENRPRVSELSGDPLEYPGHIQYHWQFMHVLGKQAFPKFALYPKNVILSTIEEHTQQTNSILPKAKRVMFDALRDDLLKEYYSNQNT